MKTLFQRFAGVILCCVFNNNNFSVKRIFVGIFSYDELLSWVSVCQLLGRKTANNSKRNHPVMTLENRQ